jgi:putative ABC transport system substrate-binding protein
MPAIGFLSSRSANQSGAMVAEFNQSLSQAGYVDGRNAEVVYRWADGQYDRLPALAAELVDRQVSVIVATGGEPSPQVAVAATQAIPIVFTTQGDPVAEGLVASLNHPGGNATGITIFGATIVSKRMALLRELSPNAKLLGVLVNPKNPTAKIEIAAAKVAADSLGQQIFIVEASTEHELEGAFAALAVRNAGALFVGSDTFFFDARERIADLATRSQLPTMYYLRGFVAAGGLMSYGSKLMEMYSQAGLYVGKILSGEKPADLPILQPTKFELVINLRAAKALGIDIPLALQLAADEMIE